MKTRTLNDLFRLVACFVVLAGLIALDRSNVVVAQAILIGCGMALASHLTRRILFPDLDLQLIALKALDDKNVPAAVVFASICAVLIAVMQIGLHILK